MESNWGKEAMKFARTEIPALLNEYKGKPDGFFAALDKRWKDRCKALKKRLAELPKDDLEPEVDEATESDGGDTDGPQK